MKVTKRNGKTEDVKFDKIQNRIKKMCYDLHESVDYAKVAKTVIDGVYDGISTVELDTLAAETAASLASYHYDYSILAARISVSSLHKRTSSSFLATMRRLRDYQNPEVDQPTPLISEHVLELAKKCKEQIDEVINYDNDFNYDYFGFRTLSRSYLLKIDDEIVERPQHMLMRVSLGIHGEDIQEAIKTYQLMSEGIFTHATPTLFNAGTDRPQMSSCFLLELQEDSIDGIYDTLKQVAKISQTAGGIGLAIQKLRSTGSYIAGSGGRSTGLVPMLQVYNATARYVNQGGKRKGSFAIYNEPWNPDIFDFLDLKKNHGKEEQRARDLFYALWIPDLFMKRVQNNEHWTLFDPKETPDLKDLYGDDFEVAYERYESEGKGKTIKAQDLWFKILESQIETGTPYMCYKDAGNKKSNQKNLGTIKSSNLCTEILQYTSKEEVAVCNLASIALPKFVKDGKFDFVSLMEVSEKTARNLNAVIDQNFYPVPEAEISNMRHRPIGIGVQGLADAYILMGYPFESPEAMKLNRNIFETIYYGAMTGSIREAKEHGAYSTFEGSPLSKGQFQFDLWGVEPEMYDWDVLREEISVYGVRNSLLLAPMPTASTSQILGNNECFEPYTSNIYTRRTLSGEFIVVNKHLQRDLIDIGMWDNNIRNALIANNGSIQNIEGIPQTLKDLYKTVWEISQKNIIDQSADRGAFVCQSQSLNIHMENANFAKLTSMHFHGWKRGLKTGMYYLRTKAATDAIKFTVEKK